MSGMEYVIEGSGEPPLVLVHGFGCSRSDWRAVVARLAPRHTTVAVDLPGHGASPPPAAAPDMESYGAGLAALLDGLALPPAVLIGHSMGCRVVLEAARRVPERTAGVVLIDGSRFAPAAEEAFAARFTAGGYGELVGGLFAEMFTARSDPAVAAAARERALALPEVVGRALLLSLARYDRERLEGALRALSRPLMVLQATTVGEDRRRTSLEPGQTTPYLAFVRACVPGARIETLAGVGHFPQLDAPEETCRALAAFIADL